MAAKLQLISGPVSSNMEKSASIPKLIGGVVRGVASRMPARGFSDRLYDLASRRDFVGGLAAPVTKLFGGLQKVHGRAQQGIAAMQQGLGGSMDDLLKNPLYQRGAKNVSAGGATRQQSGLRSGLKAPNPLSYRIGRGVGAATIGAPLFNLPFTAAEYAGAAAADPALAEEYAKNVAYQRVEDRLNQFSEIPFMDRIKSIVNPSITTQKFQVPEAADLYQNMVSNNLNNPGIMKYLASFNPFFGSPSSVIDQKVRSAMFDALQPKAAYEKKANALFKLLGNAWKSGRGVAKATSARGAPRGTIPFPGRAAAMPGNTRTTPSNILEHALHKGVYNIAKSPGSALQGAAFLGLTPVGLNMMYNSGKQTVYDSAANNAAGLADLQLMEKFNQPGFMGGLGRTGMAIAPGMGRDMILNQIRQSMFPAVNQAQG
jgi:hypothetical protein